MVILFLIFSSLSSLTHCPSNKSEEEEEEEAHSQSSNQHPFFVFVLLEGNTAWWLSCPAERVQATGNFSEGKLEGRISLEVWKIIPMSLESSYPFHPIGVLQGILGSTPSSTKRMITILQSSFQIQTSWSFLLLSHNTSSSNILSTTNLLSSNQQQPNRLRGRMECLLN